MRLKLHEIMLVGLLVCCGSAQARDRALVIGVNQYPYISGKNLRGPVADAETFADLLVKVFRFDPADIGKLTDEAATSRNILDGLQTWLVDGSNPGDRVVFYFAGHGATAEVRQADGATRLTSTIVPYDAALSAGQSGRSVANMIEGRAIGRFIEKMPGRHVMVVADSCHSGSVTRGFGEPDDDPLVRTITPRVPVGMDESRVTPSVQQELKTSVRFLDIEPRTTPAGSLVVWHAAAVGQVTFDLTDRPGGIFTQSLAAGLAERKAELRPGEGVTAGRLINYVQAQAEAFCAAREKGCRDGLTPGLEAAPAYRDFVLNPYQGPEPTVGDSSGPQAATDAQNLFSHTNDFQLTAEILPGTRLREGDQAQFRITSAEAGTLVVLDRGPDGKLTQIFPNRISQKRDKSGRVNARAPITIPDASYGFAFKAASPGAGTLLVLVAEQALDLSGVLDRHVDFNPVKDSRGLVVELADRLSKPVVSPDLTTPNRRHRWAFVAVPYVVERR